MNTTVALQKSARDAEADLIARLQAVAHGETQPSDAMDASLCQLAGRLLLPRAPDSGAKLVAACHRYFERAGGLPWSVDELTRRHAVIGLSRFRAALFSAFGVAT